MSLSNINEFIPDISQNIPDEPEKKVVPFWTQDPNVIFQYPLEFFPVQQMALEQKLNAITRLVLLLTLILFVMTKHIRVLFVTFLTLGSIAYYGYVNTTKKENFEAKSPVDDMVVTAKFDTSEVFADPNITNPFNNTLMTDYEKAEHKKPAPPAYSEETSKFILEEVKGLIAEANPEQPLINNKLFRSLEDDLKFEQSLRPFFSNPATTIPNDQTAFADFCYGSMISCKEGNTFACARNLARHST